MSEPIPADEIRIKTVAAAEAIYRLSGAANFDAALRFELRKKSAEAISLVAALSSPEYAWRRPDCGEDLYARAAGIVELVRFARDMRFIIPENAERVLNAYDAIKDYAVGGIKLSG